MGKRNTAKTGDKALYNARDKLQESSKKVDDDDMFNEVDRYNNATDELQENMIKFAQQDDSEEEGMQNDVEGVFDLGLDQSQDESDSDDSDEASSDDDEQEAAPRRPLQDSDDDDDSSIDGFDEDAETDILNWGKRKKDYYHGDTADLEIGQEVEDAELEEEGAKEVLKARLEGMTEDDFMLDDDGDSDNDDSEEEDADIDAKDSERDVEMMTGGMHSSKRRKLSTLSKREKVKHMNKTHPELLPLVSHFRDEVIRPCAEKTSIVVNALLESDENAEAVGATSTGLQYLLTKAMIETATALNVCQYLLLKRDQAAASMDDADNIMNGQDEDNIKNHPVISRLNQLNHLSDKLGRKIESKVDGLTDQLGNLVKASALMVSTGDDGEDTGESDVEVGAEDGDASIDEEHANASEKDDAESDEEHANASSSDDEEDQIVRQKQLMNEARFALRTQDDEEVEAFSSKRTRRRALPTFSDFGDDDKANETEVEAASKSLATTINRISQRSKSSKKTGAAPEATDEDDADRFKRGLEMMKADMGGDNNKDLGDDNDLSDDNDMDDDGDDFYAQIKKKSQAKKEYKKKLYAVAPKYPGMDAEIEGERPLGNMILKNRGLVAHKNKLSRNPRVKKREQYRKALIKRKGAVREVRTDEGHKYGGEETGIKSNLSRSRKLGVK